MIKTKLKDHNCGELNLNNLNEEVTLSGWASTIRDLGGILFVELRDRTGFSLPNFRNRQKLCLVYWLENYRKPCQIE